MWHLSSGRSSIHYLIPQLGAGSSSVDANASQSNSLRQGAVETGFFTLADLIVLIVCSTALNNVCLCIEYARNDKLH